MDCTAISCGCLFTRLPKLRANNSGKIFRRKFGKRETVEETWLLCDADKNGKLKEG
jgi:hypothetical protein